MPVRINATECSLGVVQPVNPTSADNHLISFPVKNTGECSADPGCTARYEDPLLFNAARTDISIDLYPQASVKCIFVSTV